MRESERGNPGTQQPWSDLPTPTPRPAEATTALQGLRVVDFTHFVSGPLATMILADLGADVIKVEAPGKGDDFRHYPPYMEGLNGEGAPFLWTNRNKRSIVLDLKSSDGVRIARELIAKADIVAENFSVGVMEKLGLGYEALARENPRLIYLTVSAYGREGSNANRRGFDQMVQAESGFVSLSGYPDREGVKTTSSIMDIATAMMASNTMMAALLARNHTGRGQRLEVSLYDTAVTMIGFTATQYLVSGVEPLRKGNDSDTSAPSGIFATKDSSFLLSCATTPIFQRLFTQVLGRPEIASDPELATNLGRLKHRERLVGIAREAFASDVWANWEPKLRAAGVTVGEIRTLGTALRAPDTRERGLVTQIPHPTAGTVPNVALPHRLSDTPPVDPVAAPVLGQHTCEVLQEVLGYDDAKIEAFGRAGTLGPDFRADTMQSSTRKQ